MIAPITPASRACDRSDRSAPAAPVSFEQPRAVAGHRRPDRAAGRRHAECNCSSVTAMIIQFPFASHTPTFSLFVARDAMSFTLSGGARVDMSTKGPLRRVLHALVENHRVSPRRGMTVEEVFRAGWDDEDASPDAKAGRVYTAFSRLRRLGLADVIERTEAGYSLDPRCCVIGECAPTARPQAAATIPPTAMSFPTRLAS